MRKLIVLGMICFAVPVFSQFSDENATHDDFQQRSHCNRETAYSTGVSDARKGLARMENYARICQDNRDGINASYNTGYNFGLTNQSGLVVNEPSPGHPETYEQLPSSYVQPYTRPPLAVTTAPSASGAVSVVSPSGVVVTESVPGIATSRGNSVTSRAYSYPSEEGVVSGEFSRPEPLHGLRSFQEISPSAHPKCIETVTGQACGFNCVNSLNNVRCAASPDQLCRSNLTGEIACGYNCISTAKTVRCALIPSDNCVSDNNGNVFCGVNCRIDRNAIGFCDLERYAP